MYEGLMDSKVLESRNILRIEPYIDMKKLKADPVAMDIYKELTVQNPHARTMRTMRPPSGLLEFKYNPKI